MIHYQEAIGDVPTIDDAAVRKNEAFSVTATKTKTKKPQETKAKRTKIHDFMERHDLPTVEALAQVFRTTYGSVSRWIDKAKTEKLDTALPGPVFILFRLIDDGLKTEELLAVQDVYGQTQKPGELGKLSDELKWKWTIGQNYRAGVRLSKQDGYSAPVWSKYFTQRIGALTEYLETGPRKANREAAEQLRERYTAILNDLTDLPR